MKIPGIIYSLLLAVGTWCINYFSGSGDGSASIIAPMVVAAVPIVLKMFTATSEPPPPTAQARGMGTPQPRSYASRVLWG